MRRQGEAVAKAGLELDAECVEHLFFFKDKCAIDQPEEQVERGIVETGMRKKTFNGARNSIASRF